MKGTDHNRQDWRFGAATLFISILALVAAFAQAYIMRQAMRLDQRAWVAPQSLVIHPKSGEPIFAQAVIANSGKTFAFKVSTDFSLKFSHERLDIEKYVQSPARQAPKTIPSLGILAPNVPYTLNVTLDEIPPTIRTGPTFLDQWEFVYFFGLVSYRDFAGDWHFTKFCGEYRHSQGAFEACDNYNDAD